MPLVLCLAFASGVASAVCGRAELRVSPRPPLLTRSFAAYTVFLGMLLVPVAVYFYVFHGDWFLLYAIDIRRVPSAIALIGFLLLGGLGALGFVVGAALVRGQRDNVALGVIGATVAVTAVVVVLFRRELGVVGSFDQYQGGFGLADYGSGALLQGTIAMGTILVAGLTYLLVRLFLSGRRG
jgi:hypothetical protein